MKLLWTRKRIYLRRIAARHLSLPSLAVLNFEQVSQGTLAVLNFEHTGQFRVLTLLR
jgi:hypothetical protein